MRGLRAKVEDALGSPPEVVAYAPGRVNVIGEHTDYIGGLALPAAIDRGVCVGLVSAEAGMGFCSIDEGGQAVRDTAGPRAGDADWLRYVAGALAVFADACPEVEVPPFRAAFTGDVPRGGGLSSSAALCVAMIRALATWTRHDLTDIEVVTLAQRIEHRWLGVQCGALDQTASQCGRAGHLLRVDFRTNEVLPVAAPLDAAIWLVLDTGVSRSLAGSAYTDRVQAVTRGLEQVRASHPGVQHWRDLSVDMLDGLAGELRARLRHGITENARVDAMVTALAERELAAAGALLDASHASLRDDYAVSCSELDALAAAARAVDGVHGARMVGAGFGGCVLALADKDIDETSVSEILSAYEAASGLPGNVHRVAVSAGAASWDTRG